MKFVLPLVALILIMGCVSNTQNQNMSENLTSSAPASDILLAKVGDHISVDYTGTFENGTIFDSSQGRDPLEFDVGSGQLIKGFDSAVVGMKEGDEKTVTLRPEDAYGNTDPSYIIEVPAQNIPNGTAVGDTLFAGGQTVKVVEIGNVTAKVDFNHPLAGRTLIFKIKIVKIERG